MIKHLTNFPGTLSRKFIVILNLTVAAKPHIDEDLLLRQGDELGSRRLAIEPTLLICSGKLTIRSDGLVDDDVVFFVWAFEGGTLIFLALYLVLWVMKDLNAVLALVVTGRLTSNVVLQYMDYPTTI